MNTRAPRQQKIIKALSAKTNQTVSELYRSTKIGRGSVFLGVKELLLENVIAKNKEKKYYIKTGIQKNKKTQLIENNKIMDFDLNLLDNLFLEKKPFEFGYALLRSTMFLLPKYTLELNSVFLTKSEKKEIQEFINKCNKTIKITFKKLHEINPEQTSALRKGLEDSLTIPQFELKACGLSNKKQKNKMKQVLKITGDIK
jgi:hypothetical protein